MEEKCRQPAVVVCHDAKALVERGFVVFACHASFKKVGHCEMAVDTLHFLALGLAQYADAPVEVARKLVAHVVGRLRCQLHVGEEGLVAYEHAVAKGAPCELAWRSESAMAHKVALLVYHVGVAIDDGRAPRAAEGGEFRNGGRLVEGVAGVEKHNVVARSHLQGFVHGVVESGIWLAEAIHFVAYSGNAIALLIVVNLFQCVVDAVSIDNEVFNVWVVLFFHTFDGV